VDLIIAGIIPLKTYKNLSFPFSLLLVALVCIITFALSLLGYRLLVISDFYYKNKNKQKPLLPVLRRIEHRGLPTLVGYRLFLLE